MTHIDLDPFYDLDPARLSPDQLDIVRHAFANAVTDFAAGCSNNHELITALTLTLSPALGFNPPRVLGEGSTRRAWSLPFGMVLKLERTDELDPTEMAWRG